MSADVDVDGLRQRLELEVLERVKEGLCGCGCGAILPGAGANGRQRYLDDRHRQRCYQARLNAVREALGHPARLTFQTLDPPRPTRERQSDAQNGAQRPKRAPLPGVRFYLPTLELAELLAVVLEDAEASLGWDARELLAALEPALERRRRRDTAG